MWLLAYPLVFLIGLMMGMAIIIFRRDDED